MKISIISKVQIKVTQEDVEELIREKIAATDPSIDVESIEFTQRRNPSRLDVTVEASYGPEKKTLTTEVDEVEEVQEELDLEEPTETTDSEEETAETVGDIFGN